jgi:hypothetical protein
MRAKSGKVRDSERSRRELGWLARAQTPLFVSSHLIATAISLRSTNILICLLQNCKIYYYRCVKASIMSLKRERKEMPDALKDDYYLSQASPMKKVKAEPGSGSGPESDATKSGSDSESEDDSNVYRLDFGDYSGKKLDDLHENVLARIADSDELINENPVLRQALIDWSNNIYTINIRGFGYYEGDHLGQAAISWINSWIYATGHADNGTRTRVALKYHFLNREPEMPGSKWVFTYGKHIGVPLDDLVNGNGFKKYDEWSKGDGIGMRQTNEDSEYDNDGKDAVADALVFK